MAVVSTGRVSITARGTTGPQGPTGAPGHWQRGPSHPPDLTGGDDPTGTDESWSGD